MWLFHLLCQKLVVLSLELLDNVLVVKQFLDGAVRFVEQVLDGRAPMLSVGLPEVAVEESATGREIG